MWGTQVLECLTLCQASVQERWRAISPHTGHPGHKMPLCCQCPWARQSGRPPSPAVTGSGGRNTTWGGQSQGWHLRSDPCWLCGCTSPLIPAGLFLHIWQVQGPSDIGHSGCVPQINRHISKNFLPGQGRQKGDSGGSRPVPSGGGEDKVPREPSLTTGMPASFL